MMNEVFNFRRFGKYFAYDLDNAKNNYGLSLVVIACIPLIALFVTESFSLIWGNGLKPTPTFQRVGCFIIACAIVVLSFPAKAYGSVTERRCGSEWILIPASSFEKFLSMVLMTCVVLPILFLLSYFLVDSLLCLVFPGYGDNLMFMTSSFLADLRDELSLDGEEMTVANNLSIWLYWCVSILTWTLGAVVFRKAKIAKTILCIMAFGFILTMAASAVGCFIGWDNISDWLMSINNVSGVKALNITNYAYHSICLIALLLLTFFRVKTIKH